MSQNFNFVEKFMCIDLVTYVKLLFVVPMMSEMWKISNIYWDFKPNYENV